MSNENSEYDNESNTEEMEGLETDLPHDATRLRSGNRSPANGHQQIEQFAEILDRMSQRERPDKQNTCGYVLPFVQEYERIAADSVERLLDRHEKLDGRASGRSTPKSKHRRSADRSPALEEEIRRWELERQTWQLAGLMLQVQYPDPDLNWQRPQHEDRFIRPTAPAPIRPFSTEHDVWRTYLATSDDAWEKHVVVEWLRDCAEADGPDIKTVVEELELKADRGNVAAYGWFYTKGAIKEEKRLRALGEPLDPTSPGLDQSLVAPDRTAGLVTQLDPDAFSRQGRNLVEADVYFERATWLACWEMVRRGRSWDSIRRWCRKRDESWRALALRGDARFAHDKAEGSKAGWQTRSLWRQMCQKGAEDGGIDVYERAVYGLMCGDMESVEKVLQDWNDHLFGLYNSQLIRNFDTFVENVHSKPILASKGLGSKFDTRHQAQTSELIGEQAWKMLIANRDLRKEAQQPLKMLQGSLIAKVFPKWILQQGLRMGYSKDGSLINGAASQHHNGDAPEDSGRDIAGTSPDVLRMFTHVILAFSEVGAIEEGSIATDNIISAYVTYLGRLGKQQLLPLYAHLLSPEGTDECMARQLSVITDSGERRNLVRLMEQYDMDVLSVLRYHLEIIVAGDLPDHTSCTTPSITDAQAERWMGQPPIRSDFIDPDITEQTEALINGVEWFLCLDGYGRETLQAVAFAYKYFLRTGHLAAACLLRKRIPVSTVLFSKAATPNGQGHEASEAEASSLQELEALVGIFEALGEWYEAAKPVKYSQEMALTGASPKPDRGREKREREELKAAGEAVVDAIEPLFNRFLEYAEDGKLHTLGLHILLLADVAFSETEATQFTTIRNAYLPELALAYITVLNTGGHLVSRDLLLRWLDVAATAATAESALGRALVQTRSTARFLEACAEISVSMLRANEVHVKGPKMKASAGLNMWEVKVADDDEE